ncbi:MAG: hypothetical protein ACD_50C00152G0012 [uncultured bacterium]|nr:MAG: hypothetical protein ACD_50C00152G0012 [uncultured bacterium]
MKDRILLLTKYFLRKIEKNINSIMLLFKTPVT